MSNLETCKKMLELYKRLQEVNNKNFDYSDAFSTGQIESKMWLLENIKNLDLGLTYVLGGWIGILPYMILMNNKVSKIRSIDLDENANKIADIINKEYVSNDWKFKAITDDANIKYPYSWSVWSNYNQRMSRPITDVPDTIINTSCEHMSDEWFDNVPKGTLVIIQTNNFFEIPDHINCCKNLDDVKNKYKFSEILYSGENKLEKYTRYMIIGYK